MKVNKRELKLLIGGKLDSLSRPDPSFRVRRERILYIIVPTQLPGVGAILYSSHTSQQTFVNLILRWFLGGLLGKHERFVLSLITSVAPEPLYSIGEFILKENESSIKLRERLGSYNRIREVLPLILPADPSRYYHSFRPTLFCRKMWWDRKRLQPKAFIGKGYNDQGTLSTIPAWQEQVLLGEEAHPPHMSVKSLLKLLKGDHPSRGSR